MSTLLLFTTQFPFGRAETYLADELPYLAARFDRVVVQAMNGGGTARPVPSNVEVAPPLWSGRRRRLAFFARHLADPGSWRLWLAEAGPTWRRGRRHPAAFAMILLWALYRRALETSAPVRRLAAQPGPRLAYAYWGHIPALGLPALARQGVPTAVRYHRVDLYLHGLADGGWWARNARCLPFRAELARTAARSLFISGHGRAYFAAHWAADPCRMELARLGTADHGAGPPRAAADGPLVIVSCSHIVPVKQVHLVAALVRALAAERAIVWHHFGAGSSAQLTAALAAWPEAATVELHGWVPNAGILAFYATTHVDLFVNLSRSEGVPVSIMEAISFGIPALATDVDGTSEVVVEGVSGMLCSLDEASDAATLARRVHDALRPGGALARARPRHLWQERFRATENYSRLADGLRALAEDAA